MSYLDPYGRDDESGSPAGARKRNLRGRFRLTPTGQSALMEYRAAVTAARGASDARGALEQAQSAWAGARSLEASDALVMSELDQRALSLVELTRALDDCGVKRPTIQGGIERLMDTGHVEVAAPSRGAE